MTIVIPVWVLWIIGAAAGIAVLFLAVVGIMFFIRWGSGPSW